MAAPSELASSEVCLPPALLGRIFDRLERKNRFPVLLVCKGWLHAAKNHTCYFEEIFVAEGKGGEVRLSSSAPECLLPAAPGAKGAHARHLVSVPQAQATFWQAHGGRVRTLRVAAAHTESLPRVLQRLLQLAGGGFPCLQALSLELPLNCLDGPGPSLRAAFEVRSTRHS